MIVQRIDEGVLKFKYAKPKEVAFLWASDGWCYVPELFQRRKYTLLDDKKIEFVCEKWEGIIPLFQSYEIVKLTTYSSSAWKEETKDGSDIFVETSNIDLSLQPQ